MATLKSHILDTLGDLSHDEFEMFKWLLQQPEYFEGLKPLKLSLLEKAKRTNTVDLIVGGYPGKEAHIMVKVLKAMNRNDLVKRFETTPTVSPGSAVSTVHVSSLPEPPGNNENRWDFLKYSCPLSLDNNTVSNDLILSEENRKVTKARYPQSHPQHPHRFTQWPQVLSRERLSECCYFEVKWSGWVSIAVSYKDINRKEKDLSGFGSNDKSWVYDLDDIEMGSKGVVGVNVNHRAGTVSIYNVSNSTMTLLRTENTTFTQPLYAGLSIGYDGDTAEVCKIWELESS